MFKYEMEKKTVYGLLPLNVLGKMQRKVLVNLISDHSSILKIFCQRTIFHSDYALERYQTSKRNTYDQIPRSPSVSPIT